MSPSGGSFAGLGEDMVKKDPGVSTIRWLGYRFSWLVSLQYSPQRLQMPFVVAPASDRIRVNRLTHLPATRRPHPAFSTVKAQTGRLPFHTAEAQQFPYSSFSVLHQSFVLYFEPGHGEYRFPVLHQS